MAASPSNQPSAKRKRLAHEVQTAPTPIRGQPYLDNGNVILAVEQTHFRIYYGVLCAVSAVFANLLSASESSDNKILVDGCPVIELDDSSEDWGYVLRNIFERSYNSPQKTPSIAAVTAYLRLGTKYNMATFRTEAVDRLTYEFPTTLAALNSTDDYSRIENPESVTVEFIGAIELAHKFDLPEILPWAFYGCCRYLTFAQICQPKDPKKPSLSPEDIKTCMVAWERLVVHQARETYAWLRDTCQSHDSDACNASREKLRQIFSPLPKCKALDRWDSPWKDGLCHQCAVSAEIAHEAGRKKIWGKLPMFFGLPSWNHLLNK